MGARDSGSAAAGAADVLDAGTGTGFVAMIAAALGHRVTAIDLAEPMLAIARAEAEGLARARHVRDWRRGRARLHGGEF